MKTPFNIQFLDHVALRVNDLERSAEQCTGGHDCISDFCIDRLCHGYLVSKDPGRHL
ncbi:MAG: hypothetical protein R3356_10000 [Eudoraea sp.]|nr:hypothetical protein [Eudoraea sp.]